MHPNLGDDRARCRYQTPSFGHSDKPEGPEDGQPQSARDGPTAHFIDKNEIGVKRDGQREGCSLARIELSLEQVQQGRWLDDLEPGVREHTPPITHDGSTAIELVGDCGRDSHIGK
jgi:hypothetical protein